MPALPRRKLPASIRDMGLGALRPGDFIKPTAWPTIDIVPSCANAAFVEFASAQYRHLNPEWTFFGAVGQAAEQLWSFLPIYLGPVLLMLLHIAGIVKREQLIAARRYMIVAAFVVMRGEAETSAR